VLDKIPDHEKKDLIVADIRNAAAGDPSPRNDGGVLQAAKGIEIGHVFKLGTKYSDALDLTVLDQKQEKIRVIMGCYGIGVNRILASAIEMARGRDDRGIIWPKAIAPYSVVITPVRYEGQSQTVADDLYNRLTARGIDVLLDDRDERPGVKFNDADLVGIPLRLTIGDKGLATGEIEWKLRTDDKARMIPLDMDAIVQSVVDFLGA
jgi:prolyl-tRNA synthetase